MMPRGHHAVPDSGSAASDRQRGNTAQALQPVPQESGIRNQESFIFQKQQQDG